MKKLKPELILETVPIKKTKELLPEEVLVQWIEINSELDIIIEKIQERKSKKNPS